MLTSLFLNLIFLKLDCDQNHLGLLKQLAFYISISDLSWSLLGPRICISNKFQVMLINIAGPETALWKPTVWEC